MPFAIDRIDHIVVNCRDPEAIAEWYARVLGMQRESFGPDRRVALKFGRQKLNIRPTGAPNWATGRVDAPGSLDLCFITSEPPEGVLRHLKDCGIAVVDGPVAKTGALGAMTSVYCRDPDGNLIEIASYEQG
ncbi:MAG: VOC family protein [Proteobacteria bacterium]|nr:VOC family protein [Pseudomonadota bacterium]MBI3496738.1 VOC family protein [Pseudomonadota bacterium]